MIQVNFYFKNVKIRILTKKGCLTFLGFLMVFGWAEAQQKYTLDTVGSPITQETFNVESPLITPGTSAVVLFESRKAAMDFDNEWKMVYTIKKRIKILSYSGFSNGEVSIPFLTYNNIKSDLLYLSASTFNLENGRVVETQVPEKDFIEESIYKKNVFVKKFAFHQVRVGSILEYSYRIKQNVLDFLIPWEFQSKIPCLWNQMELSIPNFFHYSIFETGNIPFYKKYQDTLNQLMWVSTDGFYGKSGNNLVNFIKTHWVVKNVPPFINEPYIFCQDDYKGKINFQLDGFPNQYLKLSSFKNMRNDRWMNIVNLFYYQGGFGNLLLKNNKWFSNSDVKALCDDTSKSLGHAKSIFYFVQNRFNKTSNTFGAIHNNDEVFKIKQGNEVEINLFLTSLLLKAGFVADPVILSTRDNGLLDLKFPDLDKVNYSIVRLALGGYYYFLDASNKQLGFGRIPLNCYNGYGVGVSNSYFLVELKPGNIILSNLTSARVELGKNNELISRVQYYPDYYTSTELRENNKNDSMFSKSYLDEFKLQLSPFILDSISLKNKDLKEQPVKIEYQAHISLDPEKLLYINPFLNSRLIKNPFIKVDRKYPVNLAGLTSDIYVLDLEIPKGYKIEELPKGEIYSMNPFVSFEYLLKEEEDHIQIVYKLSIQQNYFLPEEYDKLRLFYDEILKKANEFIVLKKI